MSVIEEDKYIRALVRKEIRARSTRSFATKTGVVIGVLGGLAIGAALPRQTDYVEALRAESRTHNIAATALASQYPHKIANILGREDRAFMDDVAVPETSKTAYTAQRHMSQELETEADTVIDGKSYARSAIQHPGIAGKAIYHSVGKADLTSTQTYKSAAIGAGVGALAGGLLLYALARSMTRRT